MNNDIATINASVALAHFVRADVTYDSLAFHLTLQECGDAGDKATNWTVDRSEVISCLGSKVSSPAFISSPLWDGTDGN